MIQDKTIDEALIEIMRTKKALEVLRKARKKLSGTHRSYLYHTQMKEHSAALRASLDLTHKLADLRQGR